MESQKIKLNSGREMPAIGFGSGTSFFNRGDEVAAVIGDAYKAGFRLFDCATIYGTEEGLGAGLTGLGVERGNLFITTKTPDWAWTQAKIEEEVRLSLKRLQLEYLDLVLLHTPAPRKASPKLWLMIEQALTSPGELASLPDPLSADQMNKARLEAWIGLQNCVKKGLVRDIGVSNFTANHLTKLLANPEVTIVPSVNQVEFNPYLVDTELYDFSKEKGILIQAFAPLGNGKDLLVDPLLTKLAEKYSRSPAQIALRWAWQLGLGVVTKTEKVHRMTENLDIFQFELTEAEVKELSGLNKDLRLFGNPHKFPC